MSLVSSAEKILGTKTADPPILKSESLDKTLAQGEKKNPRNRTQKKSENVAEGLVDMCKKKKKKTPHTIRQQTHLSKSKSPPHTPLKSWHEIQKPSDSVPQNVLKE